MFSVCPPPRAGGGGAPVSSPKCIPMPLVPCLFRGEEYSLVLSKVLVYVLPGGQGVAQLGQTGVPQVGAPPPPAGERVMLRRERYAFCGHAGRLSYSI